MSKNFENLRVWEEAMALAEQIYKVTEAFPKAEQYGLTSQMRRSAVSIASNIAEGCSRNTKGEYVQFIGIARGSAAELKTQLLLAKRIGFMDELTTEKVLVPLDSVARMLNALRNSLTSNQQLATSN